MYTGGTLNGGFGAVSALYFPGTFSRSSGRFLFPFGVVFVLIFVVITGGDDRSSSSFSSSSSVLVAPLLLSSVFSSSSFSSSRKLSSADGVAVASTFSSFAPIRIASSAFSYVFFVTSSSPSSLPPIPTTRPPTSSSWEGENVLAR